MAQKKNTAAEEHVRAGRAKAAFLREYFAHALYAVIPVESVDCPTMAIDRYGRTYYNPYWVLEHDVDEIATVFLHEIGHKLRRHHDRAHAMGVTHATAKIANIAQDCELNDDIADEVKTRKDMKPLPAGCVYPQTFGFPDGLVWEDYYQRLMDMATAADADGDKDGAGGAGGSGSASKKDLRNRKFRCGSGATNIPQPWEQPAPDRGGGEGLDDADWKDIERRVAASIREETAKGRGTVPGGWVDWANEILKVQRIPWDDELAGAVRWAVNDVSGKVIHNYRRPSRRQQATPEIAYPSMRRPVPNIAFIGDTSGSMSGKALGLVRGVVEDVCEACGAALNFLAVDAAVHGDAQRTTDGRSIEMRGRGGTNMVVGIEYAISELNPRPDVIIIATDCDTPWPNEEPGVPVIVCAIEANEHGVAGIPEWARTIVVEEEEG